MWVVGKHLWWKQRKVNVITYQFMMSSVENVRIERHNPTFDLIKDLHLVFVIPHHLNSVFTWSWNLWDTRVEVLGCIWWIFEVFWFGSGREGAWRGRLAPLEVCLTERSSLRQPRRPWLELGRGFGVSWVSQVPWLAPKAPPTGSS